ncbi:MAG TPA: VCBS repeat-containing protein [Anaerolineales bacterium]|nr:VCBS repeat-containing protein [Anaerolineales bacterium]
MHYRTIFLLALAALMLVSPAQLRAWQLADSSLRQVPVPVRMNPVSEKMSADFDLDGKLETLALADGHASIQTGDRVRWRSPQAWQVRQALVADLNQDGRPEAALLLWRPFQPWPVDAWLPHGGRIENFHDSDGNSCHIILIGWFKNSFRERWAGSALAEPVESFAAADLTGSGEQFLVTLEAHYNDPASAPARYLKVWEWNGFGFSLVSTLDGPFSRMAITQTPDGRMLILAP